MPFVMVGLLATISICLYQERFSKCVTVFSRVNIKLFSLMLGTVIFNFPGGLKSLALS